MNVWREPSSNKRTAGDGHATTRGSNATVNIMNSEQFWACAALTMFAMPDVGCGSEVHSVADAGMDAASDVAELAEIGVSDDSSDAAAADSLSATEDACGTPCGALEAGMDDVAQDGMGDVGEAGPNQVFQDGGDDTCVPFGATLLGNGSFESPTVPAGELTRFYNGDTLGSWTVVGAQGNVDLLHTTFAYCGYTFSAKDGWQSLDLTGSSDSPTGVSQTVATVPGVTYQLFFWVGNVFDPTGPCGVSSTVDVLVNGAQVLAAENTQGTGMTVPAWQAFGLLFTATSTQTVIEFLNADPPSDSSNLIDNVSLVGCQ